MRAMGEGPPPRFHFTRYAGVLASNAALRAEVVPGHAKKVERSDVTNDTAQGELFAEEMAQRFEEKEPEKKPTRHPWAWFSGACSPWRFSCACTVQANCGSWRSRRRQRPSSGSSATNDKGEGNP